MAAEFATSFGAWPTRFYVLRRDTLAFKIQPQPGGVFDVAELGAWVEAFAQRRLYTRTRTRARALGGGGAPVAGILLCCALRIRLIVG